MNFHFARDHDDAYILIIQSEVFTDLPGPNLMRRYLIAHLRMLILTAPWIFILVGQDITVAGLPLWAVYTVAVSTLYAAFVAYSIGKLWDANGEDRD